jgi:hypothetical protein
MVDFLAELCDGEDIVYQTKMGETRIRKPLASLLGATTPSSLATMIPESAAGHGILSRILFIYADEDYKSVPIPSQVKEEWYDAKAKFTKRLEYIDSMRENFAMTKEAQAEYIRLYAFVPELNEPRLSHYIRRRATMLMKVSMILAALRYSTKIIVADLLLAHELLHAIEPKMCKALEYFGRNKAIQGRMLILQYLKNLGTSGTASEAELMASAASELNNREAQEAIESLIVSGELKQYGGRILLGSAANEILSMKKGK